MDRSAVSFTEPSTVSPNLDLEAADLSALEQWAASLEMAALRQVYLAQNELVYAHDFVPRWLVADLHEEARVLEPNAVRKVLPGYKKSGSVSAHVIADAAPQIIGLYRSDVFRRVIERVVGRRLELCPPSDAHACALYYYTERGDHIGWHYDASHYQGERFTVLISLADDSTARLLGQLYRGDPDREVEPLALATPPGTCVIFNGDRLYHSVSPIGEGERRVVLSLEYVTNPHMGRWQQLIAGIKDAVAYFGFRQWFASRSKRRPSG